MMYFKKWIVGMAIAVLFSTFAGHASAAPQLYVFDGTAPTNAVTIHPGDSFTLTIKLTSDVTFYGFSAYLDDTTYTNKTNFTITNRTRLATNPFVVADENTDTADLTSDAIAPTVDTPGVAQSADLGYVRGTTLAAGSWNLMTITITSSAGLANGSYNLQFDAASILADANFNPVSFDNLSSNYTVTVIAPEPTMLYLLPAMLLLIRRRRASH